MLSVGLSDCANIADVAPEDVGVLDGLDGAWASANPDTTHANDAMIASCFTAVEAQPVVGMWKPADTASRAGQRVVIALVRV